MDKKQVKAHQDAALRHLHSQMQEGDTMRPCEIARATGMSLKDVNNTLERAIGKIRKKESSYN
jgi:hypothetical protein